MASPSPGALCPKTLKPWSQGSLGPQGPWSQWRCVDWGALMFVTYILSLNKQNLLKQHWMDRNPGLIGAKVL